MPNISLLKFVAFSHDFVQDGLVSKIIKFNFLSTTERQFIFKTVALLGL